MEQFSEHTLEGPVQPSGSGDMTRDQPTADTADRGQASNGINETERGEVLMTRKKSADAANESRPRSKENSTEKYQERMLNDDMDKQEMNEKYRYAWQDTLEQIYEIFKN